MPVPKSLWFLIVISAFCLPPAWAGTPTVDEFIEDAKRECSIMEYEKAIKTYSRALKAYPNDIRLYQLRANAYSKISSFEEAVADISQAIKMNPKENWYYALRAGYYWGLKKNKEAIADYTTELKLVPNDHANRRKRGHIYRLIGMYKEAIPDCERSVAMNVKQMDEALADLAYSYAQTGQTQKAIDTYTKMIEKFPDLSVGYYGRADIYEKLGKTKLAKRDRDQGKVADGELDPNVLTGKLRRN